MTNMEGWAIIFISLIVGIPLLCLVIIFSYLAHRRNLKSIDQNDVVNTHDETPFSISHAIRELFLLPDQFFKRITSNRINLWRPFLLITIGGVFFVFSSLFDLWIVFLPLVLFPLYFFWIFSTGLLYGITIPLKGEGLFITTLQNSGYGIASGLILFDLLYVIPFSFFYRPLIVGVSGPSSAANLTITILTAISLIIALWTAAMVSFGLRHSRNISLSHAAIAVVIPCIFYLLLTYWTQIRTLLFF